MKDGKAFTVPIRCQADKQRSVTSSLMNVATTEQRQQASALARREASKKNFNKALAVALKAETARLNKDPMSAPINPFPLKVNMSPFKQLPHIGTYL